MMERSKPEESALAAPLSDAAGRLRARPFRPHRLLRSPHLQTVVPSKLPRDFSWGYKSAREVVVEIENGARVRTIQSLRDATAPTLVAVHGLGGSSESVYMKGLSHKAWRLGWNSVLINLYDLNLERGKPAIFHSGSSREIRQVLEYLHARNDYREMRLAGISMGGNILLKLLGEWGGEPPPWVVRAAMISPLVDLTTSWQLLETPSNTLYRLHFVHGLKRIVRRKAKFLAPHVDLKALSSIRTIREFDEHFTVPLGGYRDADDYYVRASAAPLLSKIQVPTLVIHSRDDPLLPAEPWSRPGPRQNPNLLICLTDSGGHVGFLENDRQDIDRAWAENRIIDFFSQTEQAARRSPLSPTAPGRSKE